MRGTRIQKCHLLVPWIAQGAQCCVHLLELLVRDHLHRGQLGELAEHCIGLLE